MGTVSYTHLSGDYGLTIFKTQGGYYDPAMVMTNINPSTSMDPILMQSGASQPELAALEICIRDRSSVLRAACKCG